MDLSLEGRRALVCGASRGIGRACAFELASLGAAITAVARDASALEQLVADLPASGGDAHRALPIDLADSTLLERILADEIAHTRGCHIVINNTGGPPAGPLIDAGGDALREAFALHIVSAQSIARLMAPFMRHARYGRIVNIISTSVKAPIPGLGVSNTIRGAMANWAKTLAGELGPDGITVNNILPGFTDTDRLSSLLGGRAQREGTSLDDLRAQIIGTIPARRFAAPEETAAAVAFLCTPAAAYINGINLPVDGGRTPAL
ncbi:MAG: SDR family oxidoreductase [Phycisphaerales bacterium]